MVTYRKAKDGRWIVCGSVSEVKIGSVRVTKRDGSTKTEIVESLGRPFATENGMMVYGHIAARTSASSSARRGNGRCRECGGPIRDARHHKAMGGLCGECAFDEYDC
jgi:hypothetical protein